MERRNESKRFKSCYKKRGKIQEDKNNSNHASHKIMTAAIT